ncbi:unnamed protein product [Cuscuta campestris]|uniref:DUF6598 domain-containing protein n=1 Tax=Cuscuta campestris TaxID=132261 RepID=A0A484L1Y4_9ASTE|nr:unnamed protein product [Cuscuta campestris]
MDSMKLLKDYPSVTIDNVMKLLKAYPNASRQDVVNRVLASGPSMARSYVNTDILGMLDYSLSRISNSRVNEMVKGRKHVEAGPLLNVHSIHVQPKKGLKKRQLAVYGTIRVSYENIRSGERMELDIYNRSAKDADNISSSGGNLTIGVPESLLNYDDLWMKLSGTTIEVDLYLKIGGKVFPFAKEDILVGDTTEGDMEEVRSKQFHHEVCSATLVYIAMPFAVLCQVSVRPSSKDMGGVVNIAGKIVARYKNTCGNYTSEPCILFEKQNEFEPVKMNRKLGMSRAWLGLPAYSSLELDLDLRDIDTNKKLTRRVELLGENGMHAGEYAVAVDDFAIVVDAALFTFPLAGHSGWSDSNNHKKLCSLVEFMLESSSLNNGNLWSHDQGGESILKPSKLVEFYSIFIGRKKMAALNIFGTVEVSINNNYTHYLFKSNSNDGADIEDSQKVLPLNVTCVSFDDYGMLELKVNLEDVCGKFQNRGFATYELGFGNHDLWYNTHICSVFPGRDGFCALHYSLFPRACLANIEIILKCKSFRSGLEMIYGTAIAHYSNFDYSTKFKKDYFRSVLFKRAEKDPVPLENDGKVPLSRSVVAVPMDSSLIIEVDFCGMSMKDFQSCTGTFEIGHRTFKTETNDYEVEMKLTWSEGLRYGLGGLVKDMGCRMDGVNQKKTGVKRK